MLVDVRIILLVEANKMGEYTPYMELETPRFYTMVMDASTRRWTLTIPKFDEPFSPRFHFGKILGKPMLVDVRVILLVEVDKMGEYLHAHMELETPRVYTMVMDASTRRWTLTLPKFDEPLSPRFHFKKKKKLGIVVGQCEGHTLG